MPHSPMKCARRIAVALIAGQLVLAPTATSQTDETNDLVDAALVFDAEWKADDALPEHTVRIVDGGLVTVSVESFAFNPRFDVLDQAGEFLISDDDSGVHFNARAVVDVGADETVTVRVGSSNGLDGGYRVRVERGLVPPRATPAVEAELFEAYGDQSLRLAGADPSRRSIALQWYLAAGNLEFELLRDDRASRLLQTALELARETGDDSRSALAQLLLGAVSQRRGSAREAVELLEPLLPVVSGTPDTADFVRGYLGSAYGDVGRHDDGRQLLNELLSSSTARGQTANTATAHRRLGRIEQDVGNTTVAREHFEASIDAWRAANDRSGEASVLLDLAELDTARGDLVLGLAAYREILATEVAADISVRARSLLAEALFANGAFGEARDEYRIALSAARESGLSRPRQAIELRLAVIALRVGETRKAVEYLDALALADTTPEMRAAVQLERGLLHGDAGDVERAFAVINEAIEFFEKRGHREHEVAALTNRSYILLEAGHVDRARQDARRAVEVAGDHTALQARALTYRALIEVRAGDVALGRTLAERAVAAGRSSSDEGNLLDALGVLAEAALAGTDLEAADAALTEANHLVDWGAGLGETIALRRRVRSWLGDASQDLTALRYSTARSDDERAAAVVSGFREASRWKGRRLLEGIVQLRRGMRTRESESLRLARREALGDRDAALEALAQSLASQAPAERLRSLREHVRTLTDRVATLDEQWLDTAPRDAALDLPQGHEPADVSDRALHVGDVLIEYAQGRQQLYAYVATSEGATFVELGERRSLDAQVDDFVEAISDPLLTRGAADIAGLGMPLHEVLLTPTLNAAKNLSPSEAPFSAARLVVIPAGSLTSLPFEALVSGKKTASPRGFDELTFVLDEYEVCYAPSSSVLAELAGRRSTAGETRVAPLAEDGRVFVVADPEHTGTLHDAQAPRLPGARREARAILESIAPDTDWSGVTEADGSLSLHDERVALHLGSEAHSGRMFEDLTDFDIIHVAAHGRIDPDDARGTALLFADDGTGKDKLSIGDVLSMVLDARLTVLSACESARGAVHRGEGVQSLARAFLYAGSDAVIASLWAVDDVETARLMAKLYDGLASESDSTHALRLAKLARRHGRGATTSERSVGRGGSLGNPLRPTGGRVGHPYLWAPFVHIGSLD